MKLAFFDDFKVGVVAGDSVVDVTDVVKDISRLGPQDVMRGVIERFDALEGKLADAAAKGQGKPVSQVRFRPPLPRPENIICMAVNYMEDGTLAEPAPINAFMKSPSAIIGDGDAMVLPDMAATIFEGEAELAVVIGKRASHVKATDAMSYIFGYTNFIDGSARGVVPPTNVFYQMKSRDTFAPIGPYIARLWFQYHPLWAGWAGRLENCRGMESALAGGLLCGAAPGTTAVGSSDVEGSGTFRRQERAPPQLGFEQGGVVLLDSPAKGRPLGEASTPEVLATSTV
jgi:2-keto-4-pentenoate hydratase/2-oxohepta-3-ene-1,7-dioic acid hydratase in catechol pathway